MKKYLILLFLALLPAVVPAQESDSLDVEQPATSYTLETVPNVYRLDRRLHVSDPTGILSSEARSAIDRIFTQLEDSTGIQTAVVMLPSIGEDNIFDFAHNLFMEWGVGEKERDNGLLILYV
ncbi:MAG: TPM domain-containing protein, partial [Bacteroidaceae bacterium]|nr:TPM domain-containing protein [Bacteroidaceae bacterium]